MLWRRVVRLSRRAPNRSSKKRTCFLLIGEERPRAWDAAANDPASAALTNTAMLVRRSIIGNCQFRELSDTDHLSRSSTYSYGRHRPSAIKQRSEARVAHRSFP